MFLHWHVWCQFTRIRVKHDTIFVNEIASVINRRIYIRWMWRSIFSDRPISGRLCALWTADIYIMFKRLICKIDGSETYHLRDRHELPFTETDIVPANTTFSIMTTPKAMTEYVNILTTCTYWIDSFNLNMIWAMKWQSESLTRINESNLFQDGDIWY